MKRGFLVPGGRRSVGVGGGGGGRRGEGVPNGPARAADAAVYWIDKGGGGGGGGGGLNGCDWTSVGSVDAGRHEKEPRESGGGWCDVRDVRQLKRAVAEEAAMDVDVDVDVDAEADASSSYSAAVAVASRASTTAAKSTVAPGASSLLSSSLSSSYSSSSISEIYLPPSLSVPMLALNAWYGKHCGGAHIVKDQCFSAWEDDDDIIVDIDDGRRIHDDGDADKINDNNNNDDHDDNHDDDHDDDHDERINAEELDGEKEARGDEINQTNEMDKNEGNNDKEKGYWNRYNKRKKKKKKQQRRRTYLRFTAVFRCPITHEIWPSGRWTSDGSPSTKFEVSTFVLNDDNVGNGEEGQGEVIWYRKKQSAMHAAAARALDCLSLRRFGISYNLCDDDPYLDARDGPTIPRIKIALPPVLSSTTIAMEVVVKEEEEKEEKLHGDDGDDNDDDDDDDDDEELFKARYRESRLG